MELLVVDPTLDPGPDPARRVPALACLVYSEVDGRERWAQARDLLDRHPELPAQDLAVAATVGDPSAVARHLERDPASADAGGGPFGWTPLLHLVYARVPQVDPVGTARLLLDAGADPSAGYLWRGLPTPFTALTGCFGEGEAGPGRQPRHPDGTALATLLLDAGADPNDAQTLYNRMFGRDDDHLRLLLERGLGHGDGGVWAQRLGTDLETPTRQVQRQVDWARDHGLTERLALLAAHGFVDGTPDDDPSPWRAPPDQPPVARVGTPMAVAAFAAAGGDLDTLVDGRTLLHQAAWIGDAEMVRALLDAGADPQVTDARWEATPLGWAEHGQVDATADLLRGVGR